MHLLSLTCYSDPNTYYLFFKFYLILYDIIKCFKIVFYLTLEFACSFIVNGRGWAQRWTASHFMGSLVNLPNRSTA